jgi:hypothetical protein
VSCREVYCIDSIHEGAYLRITASVEGSRLDETPVALGLQNKRIAKEPRIGVEVS